jgi:hypothetical protein
MCPSITGGGYVAGFLKDPLDKDTSFDALQGSHGAVVGKWWEHKTVQVRPPKDLLWTSAGDNARLYSPGKFVLTTVGTNTDIVNVSVLCSWEAELSVPSLEETGESPVTEYILGADIQESTLTANSNEIPQLPFVEGRLANGTVLKSTIPFGIDYRLGSGDVTKATYACFRVNTVPSAASRLQWGLWQWDGTQYYFAPGESYYSDGQPDQVILPAGTQLNVIYDPNA